MTTIGVFTTHASARGAIDDLRSIGVADADISYLYTDIDGDIKDAHSDSKVGEGTAAGATTGAVLGAIAGFAVANAVLPGVGTLLVAGPLAAALGLTGVAATTVAGAMTGLAAGGIVGALANIGVSEEDAKLYEDLVRSGNVLVVARSGAVSAREVFVQHGAKQIGTYEE